MKAKIYLRALSKFAIPASLCILPFCRISAQNIFPANGSAGIGTISPNASSLLEIRSTTQGLLIPRMTLAQRNAIATPATGLLIYQTNGTQGLYHYNGSSWASVTARNFWSQTGNAGTNPSTNFIGTTDAQSLVFKVNNLRAGLIDYSTFNTGTRNTAFGQIALNSNTTGADNAATGYGALYTNTTGNQNVAYGKYALFNNNANDNSAYGFNAMFFNTNGTGNTAIGITALQNNTSGSNNVAVGNYALGNNLTGSNNTAVGHGAGADVSATNLTNATAIGANAIVSVSNAVILGNNTNVGIGTTSPVNKLHVSTGSSGAVPYSPAGLVVENASHSYINLLAPDAYETSILFGKPQSNTSGGIMYNSAATPNGFHFRTNGNVTQMVLTNAGKLGIGTSSPSAKFHLSVNGFDAYQGLAITNTNTGGKTLTINQGILGKLNFTNPGVIDLMTLDFTTSNVGIGTTSPGYKLDVCGTIRAKELRVETGWCDYVFEKGYKLPSLSEVEMYIKENKHLPGVTKGSEIETEGLEVAKVSAQMIRKIEELTLYVIELQKQVDALKSKK